MFQRKTKKNKNLPNLGKAYEELNKANAVKPVKKNNFLQRLGNVYSNVEEGLNVPKGNLLGLNQVPFMTRANLRISPNLVGLFDSLGPFTKGIFLDNDEKHRRSVQTACGGSMTILPVPETPYYRPNVRIQSVEYIKFLEKLSSKGQDAAKVLSRLCLSIGGGVEALDSRSGLQPSHVAQIKAWVDRETQTGGHRLVAVFDFDRTISVMEGGYFLGNSIYEMKKIIVEQVGKKEDLELYVPGFTAEGFAEYLAGGSERLAMLQEMFDYLYEHNVRVILLTNNTGCPRARNLFRELMLVYTKNRPVEVICGVEFGGDKGRAVLGKETNSGDLKSLRQMCSTRRGGRHKQKPKRRQTKRR
jgi:hypothetical protein